MLLSLFILKSDDFNVAISSTISRFKQRVLHYIVNSTRITNKLTESDVMLGKHLGNLRNMSTTRR